MSKRGDREFILDIKEAMERMAWRIHEGRAIQDELSWKEGTSKGTMSGKVESIILETIYDIAPSHIIWRFNYEYKIIK